MMLRKYVIAVVVGLAFSAAGFAQAPAGAPAGATGQCKDGSYTTNATKRGACRGHKGVQTWFAATTSSKASTKKTSESKKASESKTVAAAAPAAPAASPAPAAAPAKAHSTTSHAAQPTRAPAPGGAPNLVWVNSSSNVYHCYGSRYYGTTKGGKYETESQAKAAGAHADHGKGCGQ